MRYREDTAGELARACAAVAAGRDRNPAGTGEELIAAMGHQFRRDYGVVLRVVLFAVDRHRAHQVIGIPACSDSRDRRLCRHELAHIAARP